MSYVDPNRYVDAEPVRLHVLSLLAAGWTGDAIAADAGVSPSGVGKIKRGSRYTRRDIAARLLALDPKMMPSGRPHPKTRHGSTWVPKMGAVRRIQALMTLGWSHEAMRAYSGVDTKVRMSQTGMWITSTTHNKIARMYRALSMREGPSQRTRLYARKHGYLGPMDWDDIDHDEGPDVEWELVSENQRDDNSEWRRADRNALRDEQRQPVDEEDIDHAVVWRVVLERKHPRHLTRGESREIVRLLRSSGVSEANIERQYGINPSRHKEEEGAA